MEESPGLIITFYALAALPFVLWLLWPLASLIAAVGFVGLFWMLSAVEE